jgi:GNAT superfamily N-acetyltransferase
LVYIIMAVAGLAGALHAFQHNRFKAALAAAFFTAGAAVLHADWAAFGWFSLYTYHPGLARDPVVDAVWGEALAEAIFVPCLSVVLLAYLPRWRGQLLGTALVTALDVLFTRLGLYAHHGWQAWMTAVTFAIYFPLIEAYFQAAREGGMQSAPVRAILRTALALWALATLTLALRAGRLVVTAIHVMPTYLGNQALGRYLTYVPVTLVFGYQIMAGDPRKRAAGLTALLAVLTIGNYGLMRGGIQQFVRPWGPVTDAVAQTAAIAVAMRLEDWIVGLEHNRLPIT